MPYFKQLCVETVQKRPKNSGWLVKKPPGEFSKYTLSKSTYSVLQKTVEKHIDKHLSRLVRRAAISLLLTLAAEEQGVRKWDQEGPGPSKSSEQLRELPGGALVKISNE